MITRLLAVIVAATLTAFAPAPLPRRERAVALDGLAIPGLVGTWDVVKLQTTAGNGSLSDAGTYLKEVRIEPARWTFVYREANRAVVPYALTIHHNLTPAPINFYSGTTVSGQPYGTGIIRRQGNKLTVIYSWGSARPTSFENPPSGYWVLTLQRVR